MKKKTIPNNGFVEKFIFPSQRVLKYIYRSLSTTFNIQEGTVRSAKTTNHILGFCMTLEESPDILHLAIATTNSSARTILFEGDGLGIKYYPEWQERIEIVNGQKVHFPQRIFECKYKETDCLMLLPKKGSNHPIKYILAYGGLNADSHYPYRGYSIGTVIATEYDLLHPNTRQEIMNRTVASRLRRYFFDFNPNDVAHPVYEKLKQFEKTGRYNYLHTTFLDNPSLSEEKIKEIESEYDPESEDYKRYIKGERISPEGLIYRVRDYNIINEYDIKDYIKFISVADPGENGSATVFLLIGLRKGCVGIDVLKEYWHRNMELKGHAIKMPYDYALDYIEFCIDCEKLIGKQLADRLTDNDITFRRELDRIKWKYNYGHNFNVVKKEEINDRIKTGINLMYKERLRFYKDCKKTIESYKSAIYDPIKKKIGKYERLDAPSKGTMIDCIDSVEYGQTHFKDDLQKYRSVN